MTRPAGWIDDLLRDVRYGVRQLVHVPGFAAVTILTLAVGVGAVSAIFSVVNGVLLRSLPYAAPDRLVAIDGLGYKGEFVHLRDHASTFDVGAYAVERPVTWTGNGDPIRLTAAPATAQLFSVLGVGPVLGRPLGLDDTRPGAPPVVVLSHDTWQWRFGGAPDIIGRQMQIEATRRTVVGVMPADFRFPSRHVQLWTPLSIRESDRIDLWAQSAKMVARLRDGASLAQARAELRGLIPTLRTMFPWRMPADYGAAADTIPLLEHVVGGVRQVLLVLLGAVLAVLAIVCVNVANLMLTRGIGRQREMAIRAAIGASRARLCRQMMVESLTLAMIAGVLGVLLAYAGVAAMRARLPAGMPRVDEIALDLRVLLFTGGVSMLAGLVVGVWPALRVASAPVELMLREAGRTGGASVRQRRATRVLVVAEIALAVVLVASAALLVRSVHNLTTVDPGFHTERLVTATIAPPEFRFKSVASRREFVTTLVDRVRGLPGVSRTSAATGMPLGAPTYGAVFSIEGRPSPAESGEWPLADVMASSDVEYFRTMGIAMVEGRPFAQDDRAGAERVAVVSRSLASQYWPGESAIGARIRLPGDSPWLRVVGVAANVKWNDLAEEDNRALYVPMAQGSVNTFVLVVRTAGDPAATVRSLQGVVASVDADTPVSDIRTADALVGEAAAGPRFTASLVGLFALLALFLGVLGVYGVLAHDVSQRRQEFGVRLALGAKGGELFLQVLGHGLAVGIAGVVLGVALAFAATRALSSLLFSVSPSDPMVFAGVGVVLLAVAVLASVVPALSAAGVDPVIALRND